jgi:hypothetical protein
MTLENLGASEKHRSLVEDSDTTNLGSEMERASCTAPRKVVSALLSQGFIQTVPVLEHAMFWFLGAN